MAKAEATVEELVGMIDRGELHLPEMQRRYVWRSTRVRDLFDSLYRGYPSGAILVWDTDEDVPTQDMAVKQKVNAFPSTRLLLDGQQRLTSLSKVRQCLAGRTRQIPHRRQGPRTDGLVRTLGSKPCHARHDKPSPTGALFAEALVNKPAQTRTTLAIPKLDMEVTSLRNSSSGSDKCRCFENGGTRVV